MSGYERALAGFENEAGQEGFVESNNKIVASNYAIAKKNYEKLKAAPDYIGTISNVAREGGQLAGEQVAKKLLNKANSYIRKKIVRKVMMAGVKNPDDNTAGIIDDEISKMSVKDLKSWAGKEYLRRAKSLGGQLRAKSASIVEKKGLIKAGKIAQQRVADRASQAAADAQKALGDARAADEAVAPAAAAFIDDGSGGAGSGARQMVEFARDAQDTFGGAGAGAAGGAIDAAAEARLSGGGGAAESVLDLTDKTPGFFKTVGGRISRKLGALASDAMGGEGANLLSGGQIVRRGLSGQMRASGGAYDAGAAFLQPSSSSSAYRAGAKIARDAEDAARASVARVAAAANPEALAAIGKSNLLIRAARPVARAGLDYAGDAAAGALRMGARAAAAAPAVIAGAAAPAARAVGGAAADAVAAIVPDGAAAAAKAAADAAAKIAADSADALASIGTKGLISGALDVGGAILESTGVGAIPGILMTAAGVAADAYSGEQLVGGAYSLLKDDLFHGHLGKIQLPDLPKWLGGEGAKVVPAGPQASAFKQTALVAPIAALNNSTMRTHNV